MLRSGRASGSSDALPRARLIEQTGQVRMQNLEAFGTEGRVGRVPVVGGLAEVPELVCKPNQAFEPLVEKCPGLLAIGRGGIRFGQVLRQDAGLADLTETVDIAAEDVHALGKVLHRCICQGRGRPSSEEHTSELQSLMRISYDVFCLKKK